MPDSANAMTIPNIWRNSVVVFIFILLQTGLRQRLQSTAWFQTAFHECAEAGVPFYKLITSGQYRTAPDWLSVFLRDKDARGNWAKRCVRPTLLFGP